MAFKFDFKNKECILTFSLIAIVVIILVWMIYPAFSKNNSVEISENFNPEQEQIMTPEEAQAQGVVNEMVGSESVPAEEGDTTGEAIPVINAQGGESGPFVDPRTGTLMDGPGFEKCEIEGTPEVTSSSIPANYYFLDDGAGGEMSIQHNLCSPSCCSEQWPTPFKNKYDPYVCQNKDKFVGSNIYCNNT